MMSCIIGVCNTEKTNELLEQQQTIAFFVSLDATKNQIKQDVERLLGIKPLDVRTMVAPNGRKKAYVRLPKDIDVNDISAKLKLV
jgi:large subunit ribosomal protein L23Ae